jgi:hypothetical protein
MLTHTLCMFMFVTCLLVGLVSRGYSQTPVQMESWAVTSARTGSPLYSLSYSYDFKTKESVYVKGLGPVPPTGKFSYVTPESSLTIHNADFSKVLYSATPPAVPGGFTIEVADESAFSSAGRDQRWSQQRSFVQTATDVLNNQGFIYLPYERSPLYFLRTSYVTLGKLPRHIKAQVAVLLSQPYNPQQKEFSFRVQIAVRERLAKEEKWTAPSDETLQTSERWLEELIKKLVQAGSTK